MLELFITTLTLFLFFMILFYFLPHFKEMQYILLTFQFIICFILFSRNFYHKHILWHEKEPKNSRTLSFRPIKDLIPVYREDTFFYFSISPFYDNHYSLKKTNIESNECLKDFFIQYNSCPITDIIVENKQVIHENYTEIKVEDNKYIYFTKENKNGRLYIYNLNRTEDLNFKSTFNHESIDKIKKLEEDIFLNPLLDLKYYIKYSDFVCLSLLIFYLCYSFLERWENRGFHFIKIYNILIQIALLEVYLIRYVKFRKVKTFFTENEYYYKDRNEENVKDGYYFPNKFFNIDSFPLAIIINMLLINLLYVLIPDKYHVKCNCGGCDKIKQKKSSEEPKFSLVLTLPCLIFYIVCFILVAIDEKKVIKKYDYLIYNWKTNPIQSIRLSLENDYELGRAKTYEQDYKFYKWRDNNFKIERLKGYNYLNIYSKDNGKICGKDSFGKDLYFPENVECPINDLFISNNSLNLSGYKKIYLEDNHYLFYTNRKINGEIIIDLRAGNDFQLNLKESNIMCDYLFYGDLCEESFKTYQFYESFDEWDLYTFSNGKINNGNYIIKLNKIFYKGIDSSRISNANIINNFEKNMKLFKNNYIIKIIFLCLIVVLYIPHLCLLYYTEEELELIKIFKISKFNPIKITIVSIIYIVLLFINFFLTTINYLINSKYINNFMDLIDKYFEEQKLDHNGRGLALVIYTSYLFLLFLSTLIYNFFIKEYSYFNWKKDLMKKIEEKEKEKDKEKEEEEDNKNNNNNNFITMEFQRNIKDVDSKDNYEQIKPIDDNDNNNYHIKINANLFNPNNKNDDNKIIIYNNNENKKNNETNNNNNFQGNINESKNNEDEKFEFNNNNINNDIIMKPINEKNNDEEINKDDMNNILINNNIISFNQNKENNNKEDNKNKENYNKEDDIKKDDNNGDNNKVDNNDEDIKFVNYNEDNKNNNNLFNIIKDNNKEDNNIILISNDFDKKNSKKNVNVLQESQNSSNNSESLNQGHKPLCIICEINPTKIILAPCGHKCLCQECYNKNKSKIQKCPICNQIIQLVLDKIFNV